jgi:hypothetical protein
MIHDGIEVGEMARDRQPARIGFRIERPPRTPLVEVRDDEVVLKCAVEVTEERTLGPAWSTVEPEKDGGAPIGTACQYEELGAIDDEPFRGADRDRVRECAVGRATSQHEKGRQHAHQRSGRRPASTTGDM